MYKPKYFVLQELIGPELYSILEKVNKLHLGFIPFNPLVLKTADMLRETFGPVTINNWHLKGSFKESGLRDMDTNTGAALSAHKFGAALDCKFKNITAEEVRKIMTDIGCFKPGFKENYPDKYECFKYINRIENTLNGKQISWFHFDIYNSYNVDGSIIKLDI